MSINDREIPRRWTRWTTRKSHTEVVREQTSRNSADWRFAFHRLTLRCNCDSTGDSYDHDSDDRARAAKYSNREGVHANQVDWSSSDQADEPLRSSSYDPQHSSAENVAHLLADGNKFIAPTTFPDVHDCETYADEHGSECRLTGVVRNRSCFDRIDEKHQRLAHR